MLARPLHALTPTSVRSPRPSVCAVGLWALAGCYTPPDLPTTPYEAPILSSADGGPLSICAPQRDAAVACVVDGDTLDLSACGESAGGERVRLLGIDAPETEKPGQDAECYADLAAAELARLAAGRFLTLTFDRECTDTFGRTLAYLWMEQYDAEILLNGPLLDELMSSSTYEEDDDEPMIMLNEYMLIGGFAPRFDEDWVEPLRWEQEMIAAERRAYARRQGLWATCDLAPPASP
jgi:endonuclease YncB( thermonuclease family)